VSGLVRESLSGFDWTFQVSSDRAVPARVAAAFASGGLDASVPGCVHDDLLRHGLIEDPYLGANEVPSQWIGREDWRYEVSLPLVEGPWERVDLVADGLDTVCDLEIDGTGIGHTENMHRTYRWDVTDLVGLGTDRRARLGVEFRSAYRYAAGVEAQTGPMPGPYDEPYAFIRKMASNFGWDWGPTVVTAGIWRDIRVEMWNRARLASVRPSVTLADVEARTGRVTARITVDRTATGMERTLNVRVTVGDVEATATLAPGVMDTEVVLEVPDVEAWWPHTHGAARLYPLEITLWDEEDLLDRWSHDIGFRRIEWDTAPDERGTRFALSVNGRAIMVYGFNWIPADVLVSRVGAEHYRSLLLDAKEAGANLIRIWGGGIYEKDEFYALCNSLGLMVWQDFAFACSAYPETDVLEAEVAAEAADNVERIMPNPSLVLWNGNNENFMGHDLWGWPEELGDRRWGEKYYLDILPRVVAAVDPEAIYWPGSPYSGVEGVSSNDPDYGCYHSWVVWNDLDYTHYADNCPRFVSEFGWQGPAARATLAEALGEEHLDPGDPVLAAHQKADDGQLKLQVRLGEHFSPVTDFAAWHYLTQVNQARGVRFGLDHWHGLWPSLAGTIVWQLNDCWPSISWSAVDSAGRRKPLWYAIREAFRPRRAVVRGDAGALEVILINTTAEAWTAAARIRRVDMEGRDLAQWCEPVVVPAGGTVQIALPQSVSQPEDPRRELVVCDLEGLRQVVSLVLDRELAYPKPRKRVQCIEAERGTIVRVTAETLLRDALLRADWLDPAADSGQGMITMLPGETHEWLVTGMTRRLVDEDIVFPAFASVGDFEERA
jgi:beta-mannosidase